MKIIKKDIPIYFGWLRIVIAKHPIQAFLKLGYIIDKSWSDGDYPAFVWADKTKKGVTRYTVFIQPKCTHKIIAHEVVHLVNAVFIDRGIKLDPDNDEPQAYLTGWFVEQIHNALK